jgi:NADPH2:quinone reductase
MTTMRAIQQTEFGGPEVLRLVDIPRPVPGEGEVLICVARAGLNYADTHNRENTYLAPATLPQVPGGEVAGVRENTGERVVALTGSGGYAEYAKANERLTFPIPDGVDDGTALALVVQGLTAWHLLRTSTHMQEGESVVVQAAAGGVGTLALQLAKSLGAGRVIAVASSEDKRALALELGADAAIGAEPDGMADRIVEANGGRKVDVVLEMAGGEVFEQSLHSLAPFGRLAVFGAASGSTNKVDTGRLMASSRAVIGFWLVHCVTRPGMLAEPLAELFERVRRGELRAVVGATYPLGEVARAHEDMQARRTSGKLLLDPGA